MHMVSTSTDLQVRLRIFIGLATVFLPAFLFAQVEVNILRMNVSCYGQCNGWAVASGSGGSGPYTYQWSNGVSNDTITGLCAGVYTVTVTDAGQNTATATASITQPFLPLSVNVTTTPQICDVAPDGTALAAPEGGTPPYTYLWSNGMTSDSIFGLSEGVFTVTVTDVNGCTASGQDTVFFWPEGIWLMIQPTPISCFGANDGSIHVGAMTGTPPYSYLWSTGDSLTADIFNLGPGIYTVTVTDANGCSNTASAAITEPPPLDVNIITTEALCGKPGSATVIASGGTPPYSVVWSTDTTTNFTLIAPAGQVSVTLTDANGCTFVAGVTIPGSNDTIEISAQIIQNAGCIIGGSAALNVGGGSGNYSFLWNTPNADTTATISNIPAGTYTVTVTDNTTTCTGTTTAVIPAAPPLVVDANVTAQATCLAGATATVIITGGTAPFSVLWNNDSTITTLTGLAPGQYTVKVTDSTGCIANDTIQVLPPQLPDVTVQATNPANCIGGGGAATATPTGGTAPYAFAWSGLPDSTAGIIDKPSGTYTVTVTDAGGCSATGSVTIDQAPSPTVTAQATSLANCIGGGGTATATPAGGTAPYTFVWSGLPDTTASIANKPAGTYTVTVTDINSCTATASATIDQAPPPTAAAQATSLANCIGGGGAATATPAGGTTPYTFTWSGLPDTTANITNKPAGTYTVTVTDANSCTATSSVTIGQAPSPTVTTQMTSLANCIGSGGAATATPAGGTAPYTFAWSSLPDTTANIANKPAGAYTVTVTDANSCTATSSVTIGQTPPPTVSAQAGTLANCIGGGGSATATPAGGTGAYDFAWSGLPDTTATIGNKPAGTYTVTVTDANGCTGTGSVTINQAPSPTAAIIASTNVNCTILGSATAEATGGTPPYTYNWGAAGTGPMVINLTAGTYTVTATDANSCTGTASVTITATGDGAGLGDFVWLDNDQDGFQHPIEKGAPNIAVALMQAGPDNQFGTADDITVATTTTDANGKYKFACASPGTYVIKYSGLPAGYQFSKKDNVNNDCKDSDAKPNGLTDPFTVLQGQGDNLCIDAGIHIFCDNVTNAGLICCNQTICEGDTPALIYEVAPPSGGSGDIEFVWMQLIQMGPGMPAWAPIPGANQATYQPGPLFATTSFMRCARRVGCTTFLETNIVTVTVLAAGTQGCDPFTGNFTVTALNTATVEVQWITAPEMMPYRYTVERSADKNQWTGIQEMMGYQDAYAPNRYQTMDHAPLEGMNYYRIRRLSPDGAENVSEVREIEMKVAMDESLAVYPNPVSEILYIRNLMVYDSDARVELFSPNGAWLHTMDIPAGTQQSFELPFGHFPQGIYFVRLRIGSDNPVTVKISKM